MEMLKLVQRKSNIEDYRNCFLSLASSAYSFSEPAPPPVTTAYEGWTWTLWDHIDFHGPMTIQEIIDDMEEKHEVTTEMISCGDTLLFNEFSGAGVKKERLKSEYVPERNVRIGFDANGH